MKRKYKIAFMKSAYAFAETSSANRRKVGALIVKRGCPIAIGVNGTYSGMDNACEDENNITHEHVRHAEAAALDKLVTSTETAIGATMFVTTVPCKKCAWRIAEAGIKKVYYCEEYTNSEGKDYLLSRGIIVKNLEI